MLPPTAFTSPSNLPSTDLDPLIITSPTPRCGTTLLQRLLCSSPSALIFGEKCAIDLELLLNIYIFKVQEYNYGRAGYGQELQKVLRGEVNDWILELMPDIDGYLAVLQKSALAGIAYCRDYALQAGRPVWGFKHPAWSPVTIHLIRNFVPGARFIFILRNLGDCLKSAKAQRLVVREQEMRDFCQKWVDGVACANSMRDDKTTLVLNYEDLVNQPEETLAKLALFSGLQDMDQSVLDHKINAWMGQQFSTQSKDGYIPPAGLTDVELAIVAEMTAHLKQTAVL
jgi:hypothetical protein